MYKDVTGIILAGGKSSRMGVNKSFLKLGNQTIIERTAKLMKLIFNELIIITNSPDEYAFLNLPVYEDIYKSRGPLGGLHSGLKNSKTEKNFIISCDVPLMTKEMIEYIVNYKTEKPIAICEASGYYQSLVGIYQKIFANKIKDSICTDSNIKSKSLFEFIDDNDVEIIKVEHLPFYDKKIFFNLNSPEDFERLKSIFSHEGV